MLDEQVALKLNWFVGKQVLVSGEEALDARNANTPVLLVNTLKGELTQEFISKIAAARKEAVEKAQQEAEENKAKEEAPSRKNPPPNNRRRINPKPTKLRGFRQPDRWPRHRRSDSRGNPAARRGLKGPWHAAGPRLCSRRGRSASRVYVGMKEKACDRLGIQSQTRILPEDTTEKDLLKLIDELNADPPCTASLCRRPYLADQ